MHSHMDWGNKRCYSEGRAGLSTRSCWKNSSCSASFSKRFFNALSISSITPNNFRRILSADLGNFFNASSIRGCNIFRCRVSSSVLFVVWLTGHPHASHHSISIPRSLVRRLRGWPGNCSFRFPGPMVQYFAPAPPLPLPRTLRRGGLFPSSDVGSEGGQWEGIACDMSKGKGAM